MSKGKLYAIVGAVFGLVGVVFTIVAVVVGWSTVSFMRSAERVDGTVVEMSERTTTTRSSNGTTRSSSAWYPTVEFTVDGETYSFESSSGTNPPAYDVGDEVEVAYAPGNPNDARLDSIGTTYVLPLIFGVIGLAFTPIGVVCLRKAKRIFERRAWLLQNGQEIWAEIAHVGREFNVRVNGRHPYVVHATWRDQTSGRTYTATSDYLSRDPGPDLKDQSHVRVLFDPTDPDHNLLQVNTATSTRLS